MARTYAAILSLVGMQVVLLRAMKSGAGFDGTILNAMAWMALLGVVGFVIGAIAQQTVDESVRIKIETELLALYGDPSEEATEPETTPPTT